MQAEATAKKIDVEIYSPDKAEKQHIPQPEPEISANPANTDAAEIVPDTPQHYLAGLVLLTFLFIGAIAVGNRLLSPWNHMPTYTQGMADNLLKGSNFGVFDLNVDIRGIRRAQFAGMAAAPEVILLGASHWQEASADLLPGHEMFNAHVHRDFYDDIVAAVGLLLKNDLLPQRLVISIRDLTFTTVSSRTDGLWHPFIPDYVAAEKMMGIAPRPWLDNFQPQKYWNLFSLSTDVEMAMQWVEAIETPGPTTAIKSAGLDIIMSDGSIRWSKKHDDIFTPERANRLALEMAKSVSNNIPEQEPHAIRALSRALEILQEKGVEVVLVHPPFNPIFYREIQGTKYFAGLKEIEKLTQQLADKYGAKVAGSFNPHDLGCRSDMFIDAEHSNPSCLKRVLANVKSKFAR